MPESSQIVGGYQHPKFSIDTLPVRKVEEGGWALERGEKGPRRHFVVAAEVQ